MDVQQILDLVGALGAPGAVLMAVMWWLERGDRKEAQKALLSATEDYVKTQGEMTAAIRALRDVLVVKAN